MAPPPNEIFLQSRKPLQVGMFALHTSLYGEGGGVRSGSCTRSGAGAIARSAGAMARPVRPEVIARSSSARTPPSANGHPAPPPPPAFGHPATASRAASTLILQIDHI